MKRIGWMAVLAALGASAAMGATQRATDIGHLQRTPPATPPHELSQHERDRTEQGRHGPPPTAQGERPLGSLQGGTGWDEGWYRAAVGARSLVDGIEPR